MVAWAAAPQVACRESPSRPSFLSYHPTNTLFSNSQIGGYTSQVGGGAQMGTSEYDQNRAQMSQHGQTGFGSGIENSIQSAMGGGSGGNSGSSGGLGGMMSGMMGGSGNSGSGGLGGSMEDRMVDGEINKYVPQGMQGEADSLANKYI